MILREPSNKQELSRAIQSAQIEKMIIKETSDKRDLKSIGKDIETLFRSPNSKVSIIAIRHHQ